MAGKRTFLFLQGPVGWFFERLGHELRVRGHQVLRVNCNGGDRLTWRTGGACDFTGDPTRWPGFLRDLVLAEAVEDVVLFGDCRPRHSIASRILRPLGVRIHVFEEGYFRPDWITCEQGGVNARSNLPRDARFYLEAAHRLSNQPWPPCRPVGPSLGGLTMAAFTYYAATALLRPCFRDGRSHRPCGPFAEGVHWLRRGVILTRRRRQAEARQRALLADQRPFFLLPLQLDADMQIRRHSRFAGMREVISETVRSFAVHAPPETRLVIKNHPLDCGRVDYEAVVGREADDAGVTGRTLYLDGGTLPALMERAAGTVVVNSTVGLSSLHRGVPTIVLGRAVYDLPGLTHDAQGGRCDRLDTFWTAPEPPGMDLYRAFRRVVIERTQLNGGFYTRQGLACGVPLAADRLETAI